MWEDGHVARQYNQQLYPQDVDISPDTLGNKTYTESDVT